MNDVIQFSTAFTSIMGGWFLFMGVVVTMGGVMEKDERLMKAGSMASVIGAILIALMIARHS